MPKACQALATLLLLAASAIAQTTRTVPTDFALVQDALDASSSGDTVLVLPGVYAERLQLREGVALVGSDWRNTIIDGGGSGDVVSAIGVHNFALSGLTLRNSGGGSISPGNVGLFINGSQLLFDLFAAVEDCRIQDCGQGVLVWNVTGGLLSLEHNQIVDNRQNGFTPYLGSCLLRNNTIVGQGGSGIDGNAGDAELNLDSNIIAFNGGFGIRKHSQSLVTMIYDDVYGNDLADYWQGSLGSGSVFVPQPGTGEFSLDPLLIDRSGGHLLLADASPCIDAGNPAAPLDPDFSRADMGAIEHQVRSGSGFCMSSPNSTGVPAVIEARGRASIALGSVLLLARGVPPNESGIFYYGAGRVQVPFGNGFRCVSNGGVGLARLPVVRASSQHFLWSYLHFSSTSGSTAITSGSTWNFQAWFRDPQAGGAFFDLSDGLELTFQL